MGAFWNPSGGMIVNGKRLSKKEVAILKRNWSEHTRFSISLLQRCWCKITWLCQPFSAIPSDRIGKKSK